MASFLFLTWNGGGTTVPVLAIARELLRQGHEVRAMGHRVQGEQFANAGVPFVAYPRAGDFEVGPSPRKLIALMRHRGAALDVDEELDARPVDLVVGDPMLLSTLQAVHSRGQRYALLEATVDTLLRMRLRASGGLFSVFGLPVRKLIDGADAVVVASVKELDRGAGTDAEHIGPMVQAVAARAVEPTLLISLSTFRFPHLLGTWQRLLDAVADLPVRVIATTGPALDPAELRAPPNVELHAWGDHGELMAQTSAAVTHGGHGTTIAALAHGLPVLVVPLDASSDQPGIGRIVKESGVGMTLPRPASMERLRDAIHRLLGDEELRGRASALGARIREYGGSRAGAEALVRVAERV